MKRTIMVIGSGGREAAIVEKICKDESVESLGRIICAPGSAGIEGMDARVELLSENGMGALCSFALRAGVDLTIVGPEAPLVAGIVDLFTDAGLRIVGPTRAAAQLEGSKAFAKELMRQHGIPTAPFEVFEDPGQACDYITRHGVPIVIKADGLAAGKGVVVARSMQQALDAVEGIMMKRQFGDAGQRVVIEDCLYGTECSMIVLTDGISVLPLLSAQDYKPLFDNNEGPNTGGMGCYAPVPACTPALQARIMTEILLPMVTAMRLAGHPYRGILYAGLMLTASGPMVLEFNCRAGDPETQALLPLVDVDLLPLLEATTHDGGLNRLPMEERTHRRNTCAVCLVLTAPGYPGTPEVGLPIDGFRQAEALYVQVLHAGTAWDKATNCWVTKGGRVLNLVATGRSFTEARDRVYAAARCITFGRKQPHYRTDIAAGV